MRRTLRFLTTLLALTVAIASFNSRSAARCVSVCTYGPCPSNLPELCMTYCSSAGSVCDDDDIFDYCEDPLIYYSCIMVE
jgi:hypothetical protein